MILLTIQEWLVQVDRRMFTWINSALASPVVDWFMMGLRSPLTWIPLYAFVLFWLIRYHKLYAWQFILLTLLSFAVADYTSASILKPFFLRLRPCADPVLETTIRNLVGCGGKYGMPSSHASNHFALAAFWYPAIYRLSSRRWNWLWLWAFVIGYAQVYVGKHFPFDILVGAVLGIAIGSFFAFIFRKWMFKTASRLPVP